MSQYGELGADITDKQAKGFLILSLVSKFSNAYAEMISMKFRFIVSSKTFKRGDILEQLLQNLLEVQESTLYSMRFSRRALMKSIHLMSFMMM